MTPRSNRDKERFLDLYAKYYKEEYEDFEVKERPDSEIYTDLEEMCEGHFAIILKWWNSGERAKPRRRRE